jgi:L-2-hydroxyglutarate oxidase
LGRFDFGVIGGGIVGLASALALTEKFPGKNVVVLEKENAVAQHQSGRNSGVIHAGTYYRPGTMKAKLCRDGNKSMVRFCAEHGILYETCGKVIVATAPAEIVQLDALYQRGVQNGLSVTRLSSEQVCEIEPHVKSVAGIHVADEGITDYQKVSQKMSEILRSRSVEIKLGTKVLKIFIEKYALRMITSQEEIECGFLINCAGLYSDRVARMLGVELGAQIVPFRGEYYELKPARSHLVKHLIYPVPDPSFPFLGVHFTRSVSGHVHAGPNAVLAMKREGYSKTDIDLRDLADSLFYPGFLKLAARHFVQGLQEVHRSISKRQFVASLQRLIPEIQEEDLIPAKAGIRAQALDSRGKLIEDFLILSGQRSIHVCNAPSPAATSSLEIGKVIAQHVMQHGQAPALQTPFPDILKQPN